ncbi:hypothetical protein B0H21DRAFT_893804 [Amylocystis lapponica]|nr:hypothetical protein B0H21DRAFT_893804 [Amylocystis lapponica]
MHQNLGSGRTRYCLHLSTLCTAHPVHMWVVIDDFRDVVRPLVSKIDAVYAKSPFTFKAVPKARSTTSERQSVSVTTNDDAQIENDAALSCMTNLFHDKIDREYPVQEFVKHVWNFDENDHPDLRLKIRSFMPRPAAVDTYNDAPNEILCYPHLAVIIDALLTHLFPAPMVHAVRSSVIFVRDGSVTGEYTSFQPDMTWSTTPKPTNGPWDWLLLFAEVKREKAEKAPSTKNVRQGNVQELTRKTLKRKSPDSKDEVVEPSPKRRKQAAVSPQEAQTAKYLNGMLSHGIRSYASGFCIKDRDMHLWYGDRMGLVKSCVFDWQTKPALMALVFAAVGTANLAQLGISPFLEFSLTSPKFESYEGGRIVLPASEVGLDGWGAVGRGTTIVPLEAIGAARDDLVQKPLVAKMAWPQPSHFRGEYIRIHWQIMFYRDAEGHVVGVLCDWDLAGEQLSDAEYEEDDNRSFHVHPVPKEGPTTTVDPQRNVVPAIKQLDGTPQTIKGPGQAIPEEHPRRPRYRNGTASFIALDMLHKEPPLHHYRHELESFFFLLSFVCAVFDPERHQFGSFSAWEREISKTSLRRSHSSI